MLFEAADAVKQDDIAHGDWCVDSQELNMWVDAHSLATGVALERYGTVLGDACWLRPETMLNINSAELDTMLKNINLALPLQDKIGQCCT